jgi:hypothetical protein
LVDFARFRFRFTLPPQTVESMMAKRTKRPMPVMDTDEYVVLKPADIARALDDISVWIAGIRRVVLKLPRETTIVVKREKGQKDHRIDYGCPPPE